VIDADMQGALSQSLDPDVGGCIHLQALPEVLAPGLGRVDPYPWNFSKNPVISQ
ncbi:hypothetical protein JF818_16215, partial [Sphaerochaeta sp. S2]|nr:hypothetical protein [Sphaerochaeta sp. S2]